MPLMYSLAQPNWNEAADINGDNAVDIYDLILLASNFGKSVTLVDSGNQALHFTTTGGSLSNVNVVPGDLNNDGIVNVLDAIVFSYSFGSFPVDPGWNPEADMDGNGEIEVCDLVLIAMRFGTGA